VDGFQTFGRGRISAFANSQTHPAAEHVALLFGVLSLAEPRNGSGGRRTASKALWLGNQRHFDVTLG
jgi:hypothetical protein